MTNEPRYCAACKFSEPEKGSEWNLRCLNKTVNMDDAWALASATIGRGTNCHTERERGVFARCGKRGAQWMPK